MAETSSDKELNPFLQNLEESDLEDSSIGGDSIDWDDIAKNDYSTAGAPQAPTEFSPASQRLLKTSRSSTFRKNKWTKLYLVSVVLFLGWYVWANFIKIGLDFEEPFIDDINNIELEIPALLGGGSEFTDDVLPEKNKLTVAAGNVGIGSYYLKLDKCSFSECVSYYEEILGSLNLPISKDLGNSTLTFYELVSQANYLPAKLTKYMEIVENSVTENMKIHFIPSSSGKNFISLGLFTTIQKTKDISKLLDSIALENDQKISFRIRPVYINQEATYIFAGPFKDEKTANYIKAELALVSTIKNAQVVNR